MGSSRAAALFASPAVVAEPAAGDCLLLRSAEPLGGYPVSVIHSLRGWALEEPDHPLVAERAAGGLNGATIRRTRIVARLDRR